MIRWGLAVVGALVLLVVVAWSAGWDSAERPEPKPTTREPTQAERIIEFCSRPASRGSVLCKVDPEDEEAVEEATRRILEQRTTGPQIIEREIRENDDDDDAPAPRVTVVVPRQPTSQPTPAQTTRPPLVPDIPEMAPVPKLPESPLGLQP